MRTTNHTPIQHTYDAGYRSVEDYLMRSRMTEDDTWGGDFELSVLTHLLNASVYSFQGGDDITIGLLYFPHGVDP